MACHGIVHSVDFAGFCMQVGQGLVVVVVVAAAAGTIGHTRHLSGLDRRPKGICTKGRHYSCTGWGHCGRALIAELRLKAVELGTSTVKGCKERLGRKAEEGSLSCDGSDSCVHVSYAKLTLAKAGVGVESAEDVLVPPIPEADH